MAVNRVVELARECIDTPFRHQGRNVGLGLDCAGVLAYVISGLGLPVNDSIGYPRTPVDGKIRQILNAEPSLERIHSLEDGCVVLFRITKEPQHVAIWTGESMIHSYISVGKVVESGMGAGWRKRIVGLYRIKTNE